MNFFMCIPRRRFSIQLIFNVYTSYLFIGSTDLEDSIFLKTILSCGHLSLNEMCQVLFDCALILLDYLYYSSTYVFDVIKVVFLSLRSNTITMVVSVGMTYLQSPEL